MLYVLTLIIIIFSRTLILKGKHTTGLTIMTYKEAYIESAITVCIILFIIGIISFFQDKRRLKKYPETMRYKWGYFLGWCLIIFSGGLGALRIYRLDSYVFLFLMLAGIFIICRRVLGWYLLFIFALLYVFSSFIEKIFILHTMSLRELNFFGFLLVTIIYLIIQSPNFIYFKRRYEELKNKAST